MSDSRMSISPIRSISIHTRFARELVDISDNIQRVLTQNGIQDGICFLFLPHTTAALTANENWDPDVSQDMLFTLHHQTAPPHPAHKHGEGNSPAHLQSSLLGATAFVFVENGRLWLGQWQGIFLAEFDGPRERHIWIKCMGS